MRVIPSVTTSVILLATAVASAYAQTPAVSAGGVSNAANGISPVAPGSLVSIYGSELAAGLAQADTIPLATTMSNISVTFNGVPAPLLFVSGGQINAQLPWNVLSSGTAGTATVVVTRNNQASAPQSLQVGPFSPGIFAIGNIAAAINSDGSIAAPAGAIPGIATKPAKIGDPAGLVILCTGLGTVDPPAVNGADSLDALRTATNHADGFDRRQSRAGGLRGAVPAIRRRESDQRGDSNRHSYRGCGVLAAFAGRSDHDCRGHDRGEPVEYAL